jgi:CO/xanthine dehydrogenase Mo-binding subunit
MSEVGRSLPRLDVREKVTGRAEYIADLRRHGMLHGAILASPHAHARIVAYRIDAALAAPGVRAVVTGDDCPDARMGAFIKDETAIAKGRVRYVGEPVAAVAADSEEQARAACRLIDVDYEVFAAILTPDEALAGEALAIHPDLASYDKVFAAQCGGNVCSETSFSEGDVDAAFAQCDLVLDDWFSTQAQAHVAMEPCGALAEVDAAGRVTLWSTNQSVFRVQANVCESLALPMSKLRCLTPRVGGAFGNKMEAHVQPVVVMLALKSGRPVRLVLSREEDFEMVRARHPYRYRLRTGAMRDGSFVARDIEIVADGGAYADDSPGVLGHSLRTAAGPYRFRATRAHGKMVYTNKLRSGAFRGFGQPQIQFGAEQHVDEIARRLAIDPIRLRRQNLKAVGEPWFGGQKVLSNGLAQCLDAVEAASGWSRRSELAAAPGKRRALGLAVCGHISATQATGAIVRLLEDGTVVLNTGATDIGQGSDTVLTQMCAGVLNLAVADVALASPDTDGSPYNWGTTASRVTYTTGRSVVAAAEEVARKIKAMAATMLECQASDLELRAGGRVGIIGDAARELSFKAISGRAHWVEGGPILGAHTWIFDQPTIDPKRAVALGNSSRSSGVFSFGALVVDVEVDELSGKVTVLRAWSAADVGKAINPMSVEGQLEGAFVQGLGYALSEEMVWDGGRLANPSMMDYKIPSSREAPYEIHALIVESPEPGGPFGAKGAGEVGINTVAPAIANAVSAAVGVRYRTLPLSPERVLGGLLAREDH